MIDDSDFEFLNQWKWRAQQIKGIFYAVRGVRIGKRVIQISMHRQILGVSGRWDIVDHIDGNGLNNQKSNLRICTNTENLNAFRRPYGFSTSTKQSVA